MMNCDRVNAVGVSNDVAADYADRSDTVEPCIVGMSVCDALCVDAVDDVVCGCDRPMAAVLPVSGVSGSGDDSVCVSVRCGLSGWMGT